MFKAEDGRRIHPPPRMFVRGHNHMDTDPWLHKRIARMLIAPYAGMAAVGCSVAGLDVRDGS